MSSSQKRKASSPRKPRKRARLTMAPPRKRREPTVGVREPGVPTEAEFACMTPACAFNLPVDVSSSEDDTTSESETGSDTESTDSSDPSALARRRAPRLRVKRLQFKKGDDVIMHSLKDGTADVWLGRIDLIRKAADGKAWAKVHWYYSRNDLDFIKSFDKSDFAPYERAVDRDLSNLESPLAFLKPIYVHTWDENGLSPPELTPTTYFCRTHLRSGKKILDPEPGRGNCLCNQAYNPFPEPRLISYPAAEIMHFCPRLECSKWYHPACLQKHGFCETDASAYRGSRGVRLLAVNPDTDFPCALLADFAARLAETAGSSCEIDDDEMDLDLPAVLAQMGRSPELLAHLPPALLEVAQSPIMRRPGPARDGWSPVGNVAEVTLARRLVYAAFEGMASARGHCAESVEVLVRRVDDIRRARREDKGKYFACPMTPPLTDSENSSFTEDVIMMQALCDELGRQDYTIIASPYLPYWERRAEQLRADTRAERPPLICPNCRGAI